MREVHMKLTLVIDNDDGTEDADIADLIRTWIEAGRREHALQTGVVWPRLFTLEPEGTGGE